MKFTIFLIFFQHLCRYLCLPYDIIYPEVLRMQHINKLFTVEYNNQNISLDILDTFINVFENELKNIYDQFDIKNICVPLTLCNKQMLDEDVKANSVSYKNCDVPSWLVGFSSSKGVWLLEPNENNINNMIKVALHESIHYIMYNTYPTISRSKLLDEGLATYYSKQNYSYTLKQLKDDLTNNTLKKISDLSTQDSVQFAKIKGYTYCYYVIDFLIQNFGIKQILDWYKNTDSFNEDIYNLDLNTKFIKYLREKLSD